MSKVTGSTGQTPTLIQQGPVAQQSSTQTKSSPRSSSTPSNTSSPKASQKEVRSRVSEYKIGGQARQAELESKLSLHDIPKIAGGNAQLNPADESEDYSGSTGGEEQGPPPGTFDNSDWVTKGDSEPESEALRAELMARRQTEKLNDMLVTALTDAKEATEVSRKVAEEVAANKKEVVQDRIDHYDKNGAINTAVEQYEIDTSSITGRPKYDKSLGRLEGKTFADGTVVIGEAAFKSPGWLASTIGHEAQHAEQITEGRWYTASTNDPQALAINEVECYDWELSNASKNGLTDDEIKIIKQRRDEEMAVLDPGYKLRVLSEDYSWP